MMTLTNVDAIHDLFMQAGMTAEQATAAITDMAYRLFIATAHPFEGPTYLDVVKQIPGWAALFTEAFGAAMLVIAAIAIFGAFLAWLALRRGDVRGGSPFAGGQDDAPASS